MSELNTFCFTKTFDSLNEAIEELRETSWSLAMSDLDVIEEAGLTEEACKKVRARRSDLGGHGLWAINTDKVAYDLVRIDRYGQGEVLVFTTCGGKNQVRFTASSEEGGVVAVYRVETRHTAVESSAVKDFTAAGWQRCDFINSLFLREDAMRKEGGDKDKVYEEVYAAFGGVDFPYPYVSYPGEYDTYEMAFDGPSCEHMGRGWH